MGIIETVEVTAVAARVSSFDPGLLNAGFAIQIWHDGIRGTDRVIRYKGRCTACSRVTWGADDGENDPRGELGDYASSPLAAADYDMVGPDVPMCFNCANTERSYNRVLNLARTRFWKPKPAADAA